MKEERQGNKCEEPRTYLKKELDPSITVTKEDASKEERYGYGYNYIGISPVSSGSFIQPGIRH